VNLRRLVVGRRTRQWRLIMLTLRQGGCRRSVMVRRTGHNAPRGVARHFAESPVVGEGDSEHRLLRVVISSSYQVTAPDDDRRSASSETPVAVVGVPKKPGAKRKDPSEAGGHRISIDIAGHNGIG
jgi:hypothetical protein